jgi:hypothetical protein
MHKLVFMSAILVLTVASAQAATRHRVTKTVVLTVDAPIATTVVYPSHIDVNWDRVLDRPKSENGGG